jgi:HAD superfamily hydrolase (TIGR01509 family)
MRHLQGPAIPTEVRGLLLDVDGTLVDSNEAHARAWQAALREAGHDVAWARIRRLIGMGADKLVPRATGLSESDPKARRIVDRRAEVFLARELATVQPLPGVRELLERMRGEGLRWAVATSARPEEVQPLLERGGVADLVVAPPASTGGERSKPDPNVLCSALDRLGLPPHEVVMLGDTPYDLEAARLANVASILFRTGGWPDVQLAGAAAIYDGPWDLLARFEDSILRRKTRPSEAAAPGP